MVCISSWRHDKMIIYTAASVAPPWLALITGLEVKIYVVAALLHKCPNPGCTLVLRVNYTSVRRWSVGRWCVKRVGGPTALIDWRSVKLFRELSFRYTFILKCYRHLLTNTS